MLTNRLDVAETMDVAIDVVAGGSSVVRPAAASVDVPHATARGWIHRFASRAREPGVDRGAATSQAGWLG